MASKVPKFGAWESGEDAGYTVRFETVRKSPGGPIINPNDIIQPNDPKPKQKQPEFGAWGNGEEEEVSYTQYFEQKTKPKTSPPREPQINYNMGPKIQPSKGVQGSEYKRPINAGESRPTPQGVKFVDNNAGRGGGGRGSNVAPRQRPQASAGPNPNRGGSVPAFGDWNSNPSQAEGYTVVFKNLQDEKRNGGMSSSKTTPTHPSYSSSDKEPKQGSCCPFF